MAHKSFLKWAGGKMQLLEKLQELGIEQGKRFVEPFVGSGVITLNMPHKEIIIADTNVGLMNLWRGLAQEGELFIDDCRQYFSPRYNNEMSYYDIRKRFNQNFSGRYFLYLNKFGYNGLCRYNASGQFNVPYGHKKVAPAFPEKELQHAFVVAERMSMLECSFDDTFAVVKKGDMVFADPPYVPINKTSSFVNYSTEGFTLENHKVLVECAKKAQLIGATVIISNNDVPVARKLYKEATEVHFVKVQKNISCKAKSRTKHGEIIAVYRPK